MFPFPYQEASILGKRCNKKSLLIISDPQISQFSELLVLAPLFMVPGGCSSTLATWRWEEGDFFWGGFFASKMEVWGIVLKPKICFKSQDLKCQCFTSPCFIVGERSDSARKIAVIKNHLKKGGSERVFCNKPNLPSANNTPAIQL